MKKRSVRLRVAAFYVVSFLTMSLLSTVLYYRLLWKLNDTAEQQTQADLAQTLAERLELTIESEAPEGALRQRIAEFLRFNPENEFYLLDQHGNILESFSGRPYREKHVPLAPILDFLGKPLDDLPIYNRDPISGGQKIFSAAPFLIESKPHYLYAVLNGSERFLEARGEAWKSKRVYLQTALLSSLLVFCFLLGLRFLVYFSNRFDRLLDAVNDYQEGKFTKRTKEWRRDEFGVFANNIDEMADKIDSNIAELSAQDEMRTELIANISHDLRSPATHIRLAVDELNESGEPLAHEVPLFRELQRNSVLLERTLRDLFELTKLETQEAVSKGDYISLEELLLDMSGRLADSRSSRKPISVRVETDSSMVQGDAALLSRAVGNLLEALIADAAEAGEITAAVDEVPGAVRVQFLLTVAQEGKGEDAGLGLAIAEKILKLHGTTLLAGIMPHAGKCLSFSLPHAES